MLNAGTTTTATAALQNAFHLDRGRPAVMRTAEDIIPRAQLYSGGTTGSLIIVGTSSRPAQSESIELKMSPWLRNAMAVIATQRTGSGIGDERLGDAERLAALFASADASRRPQLNILDDGVPSFATSINDFYLHITIDRPGRITWFATRRSQEHFSEDVPFDGRSLPQEIQELLSA